MRKLSLFLIIFYSSYFSLAQKKLLGLSTPASWPILTPHEISNDGKFVSYSINSPKIGNVLVVQATKSDWKKEIPKLADGRFTADSRRLILSAPGDSLGILDLVSDSLCYITEVINFAIPAEGNGQWLAYLLKKPEKELVLHNLFTGEERHFSNVKDFIFSNNGNVLVMQACKGSGSVALNTIFWLDLVEGKSIVIGRGYRAVNMAFDKKDEQFAFLAMDGADQANLSTLRYYVEGMDSASIIASPSAPGMSGMIPSVSQKIAFSPDGRNLFFFIERVRTTLPKTENTAPRVEIHRYFDDDQRLEAVGAGTRFFLAVIRPGRGNNVTLLQEAGDRTLSNNISGLIENYYCSDFVLVLKDVLSRTGVDSNKISVNIHDIYLVSCQDGSRVLVKKWLYSRIYNIKFSVGGKYLCWYDEMQKHWFAYNIELGLTRNITSSIRTALEEESDEPNRPSGGPFPMGRWLVNDAAVFIPDRHDIWQVDPEGAKLPVNLTNGYGLKHHIQFQYLDFEKEPPSPIHIGDTLLFSALDDFSKMNGFFQATVGHKGDPEKLVMEPRIYFHIYLSAASAGTFHPFYPIKAKSASVYALERMSATEYPNLYVSTDLKEYRALSHLEPQKEYNWFTSELFHWKLPAGGDAAGVLYKPENFDPHKKYPVIFFFYEKNAAALNSFIHPALSWGAINIPWFVSNGYLVFVPDIFYKIGYPGRSAYDCVVSAALSLSRRPYVDNQHMGLQGHSFGAFETNYIVSHTQIFAAAAPASDFADLISGSASVDKKWYYENGQGRLGASMWQRLDLYIENSPIFRADKVTTPILIMHNRNDMNAQYIHADEWYNGLVRLGKKVWMLSYDGEQHLLENEQNQLDYTIRQIQFFDHFLKGKRPPKWMTFGLNPQTMDNDNSLDY